MRSRNGRSSRGTTRPLSFRTPHSPFRTRGGGGAVARVVAVFGGGGAKSLAHAGAWQALLESGLQPFHIVGTSMGAVIGAALAAGSTYQRIVDIALSLPKKDFAALDAWSPAKGGFAGNILKPEPLKRPLAPLVPATRFGDMHMP